MIVGRNDPCPCGSGKKYKKCCMTKQTVVEMGQARVQKFFQRKFQLIQRMKEDILSNIPFQTYVTLRKQFSQHIHSSYAEILFEHWLLFFYKDENGLRGIEAYNQYFAHKLDPALRELAQKWEHLVPKLIQQVDYDHEGVFVQDLFSNEIYHMPYCETMREWEPWAGTFCFLEEFDGQYYMNGIAVYVSPTELANVKTMIETLLIQTDSDYETVAMSYYPQILGELLKENDRPFLKGERKTLKETELHFQVTEMGLVVRTFNQMPTFRLNEYEHGYGKGSIIKKKYFYRDNTLVGTVVMEEVEGFVEFGPDQLKYRSTNETSIQRMKQWMSTIPGVILKDEKVESITIPASAEAKVYSFLLPEGAKPEFGMIAQFGLALLELDVPLPLFGGLSPKEMSKQGRYGELERWLQEQEYNNYKMMKYRLGSVEITADFNTIRKELGLPISPFVTMREERKSEIEEVIIKEVSQTKELYNSLEEIGIPFQEENEFYIPAIVEFFNEKARGKSENTYYKYRMGLQTLSAWLNERSDISWKNIKKQDWLEFISFYYLDFNYDATINQVNNFFSVIKGFTKWLDQNYKTNHSDVVKELIMELEIPIKRSIAVLDCLSSFHERKYGHSYREIFRSVGYDSMSNEAIEDYFLIKKIAQTQITIESLTHKSQHKVNNLFRDMKKLEEGMIIDGIIGHNGGWKLIKIIRVFPNEALPFIKKNIREMCS